MKNIKSFLKKNVKYYFFFIGIMVLTAFISSIVPDFIFFNKQELLTDRKVELKYTNSDENNKYMWWEIDKDTLILNVAKKDTDKTLKVYGSKFDQTSDEIPVNSKNKTSSLKEEFSGSFNASLKPFKLEPENKESKKMVYVNAKLDTIYVSGFVQVWTNFEKEKVSFDIIKIDEHTLSIFYKGNFIANKNIHITSSRGLDKYYTTNEDGIVVLDNIKDLRSGLIITYIENDTINISSYIAEGNTLFSKNHFNALYPLFFVLALSAEIILLIIIFKQHLLQGKNTLPEIKP